MPASKFEIDSNTPLGALLDRIIRSASVRDLTDFYLGADVDYDNNTVAIYFTEGEEEASLKERRGEVEEE